MAVRNQVTIYLDSPEQLRTLRVKAAEEGVSMAELGKRALVAAFFLPCVTNETIKCESELSLQQPAPAA